eukprot:g69467.t1
MPRAESQDDFLTDLTAFFKNVKKEQKGTVQITLKRHRERIKGEKPPLGKNGKPSTKRACTLADPVCLLRARVDKKKSSCQVKADDVKFREEFGVILRAHADGLLAKGEQPKPKPKSPTKPKKAAANASPDKARKDGNKAKGSKADKNDQKAARKRQVRIVPSGFLVPGPLAWFSSFYAVIHVTSPLMLDRFE